MNCKGCLCPNFQHSVDPALVASLYPGLSDDEIADAIVIAQGTAEIAETRAW